MSEAKLHQLADSKTLTLLRQFLKESNDVGPAVAKRADLSISELDALELLFDTEIGPSELAKALGVTTAAATGVVDRLRKRGHVTTRPHEQDGRRILIKISPSGQAEVWRQLSPMFKRLAALDARLTDEERVVIDRYLTEVIGAVRAAIRGAE